jgi:hypothetical protein
MEIIVSCATILSMFLLAGGILWLRDIVTGRPRSPEQIEQEAREWDAALQRPDWPLVAAKFGAAVPTAIERLYSGPAILLEPEVDIGGEAETVRFVPANADAFDSEQWFDVPDGSFVFATTVFGDPFYVRLSESDKGYPVYLLYHDGGDIELVAESVEEFVGSMEKSV